MKFKTLVKITTLALAAMITVSGCGDNDSKTTDPPVTQGDYEIVAGFVNPANQGKPGTGFIANIERLNASAEGANNADIDVEGTTIPLISGNADEASYQSDAVDYVEGNSYDVLIELGNQSATSIITAPPSSDVTIVTPADNSTFSPGDPVNITWQYSDKAIPPECFLEVEAGSTSLIDLEFAGSTTSYNIPGSTTSGWGNYDEISIMVGAGATTTFTGDMVSTESTSFVMLSSDTITIDKEQTGQVGTYQISASFIVNESGTSMNGIIGVERLNSSDTAAHLAVVQVNSETIPLFSSDANEAIFMGNVAYSLNQAFTVTVTVDTETATASFTAWDRHCVVNITSPTTMSEFTAGPDLDLVWEYVGTTPDAITVGVAGSKNEGAITEMWPYQVAASATSVTMSTSAWAGFDMITAGIESSDHFNWTGSLAGQNSTGVIVYMMDAVILLPAGTGPSSWYVDLDLDPGLVQQGGTSTATVTVTDIGDNPCPDNTVVTFTADPANLVTLGATTATTTNGEASITITAGDTDGTTTITASALEDTDHASLTIGGVQLPEIYFINVTPDPDSYPNDTYQLPHDGASQVVLNFRIEEMITSDLYTGEAVINIEPSIPGYVTLSTTTVGTTDGTGQVTVTAGTVPTAMFPFAILFTIENTPPPHITIGGSAFPMSLVAP